MKKTLTIIRHEFKQTMKRKFYIIATVALPLLLMLGYGIYQGVQHWQQPSVPQEIEIGYVDETGLFNEYDIQDNISDDITFKPYYTEVVAKDDLLIGDIEEYFVIPSDYISTGFITRYTMDSELEVPGKVWWSIESFLLSNLLGEDVGPEILERAKTPMILTSLQFDESGEIAPIQDEATRILLPIVFGMLFMLSILFTSGFLLQSLTEEKENRIIEVLLSSVSSRQLLVGKVLGLGAAGLLQIVIWLLAIRIFAGIASVDIAFLSEINIPPSLLAWGIVYFVLGYLMFATIYAGIGSMGRTAQEGNSIAGIMVMPAGFPVWLNFFILDNPDGIFPRVLTLFPLTAPVTAMMRLSSQSLPAWELALSLAILVGSVALGLWAAAKVFRTFLLMYGKKPALRDIVKYMRQA
jgi:ABC-2 type transport system permease protein